LHEELGPGLLESIYEIVLADVLASKGFTVQRQVPIPIQFAGKVYDEGFRADLIVEGRIIVEIKSVERLAPVTKSRS
jgi:GxxExxY protein